MDSTGAEKQLQSGGGRRQFTQRGSHGTLKKSWKAGDECEPVRPRTGAPPDRALPFQPSSPHRPAPCETGHVSLFTAEQLVQPSGSVRRYRKRDGCRPRTPATPRHYSTKAFALPLCLATPLSPPSSHPGTPRFSSADFLPVARRGSGRAGEGWGGRVPAGLGGGGVRARTVSPHMGSQPPSPSPPRHIRQRAVPGASSPGQPNSAGRAPGGSRACLPPPGHGKGAHGPAGP